MATSGQRRLMWCAGVAIGLVMLGIGFSVDLNASDQEPLLTGIGALVALGGFWGSRLRQQWLAQLSAGISGVGAFAALVFAAFHWWLFVFLVAVIAKIFDDSTVLARERRGTSRERRNYLDDLMTSGDGVTLRAKLAANKPIEPQAFDDPDAVTVYAHRGKAALSTLRLLGGAAILCAIVYGISSIPPTSSSNSLNGALVIIGCLLFIVLCIAMGLVALSQVIRPRPLVAIGRNGIILRSASRIRWDEIVGMDIQREQQEFSRRPAWLERRALRLRVANPAAVRARQPRWVQVLVGWSLLSEDFSMKIYERLLPMSLEALVSLILPHVEYEEDDPTSWSISGPRGRTGIGQTWKSTARRRIAMHGERRLMPRWVTSRRRGG